MTKLRLIFANRGNNAGQARAMTCDEVQALVTDGLVEIGAHTVTHPMLANIPVAACHREITESKLACEALSRAPALGFAYPYGNFDTKVREAVKAAGFTFACSTQGGPAVATSDVFTLPRLHVCNWDGEAFERALREASAD